MVVLFLGEHVFFLFFEFVELMFFALEFQVEFVDFLFELGFFELVFLMLFFLVLGLGEGYFGLYGFCIIFEFFELLQQDWLFLGLVDLLLFRFVDAVATDDGFALGDLFLLAEQF